MADCIFCKMVAGEIKPNIVFEDQQILAFRDINPQAPVHILIIPKVHCATMNELTELNLAGKLLQSVSVIAKQEGIADSGYRMVVNCNSDGGQEVYHLHLHLLGGRKLSWPPG